MVEGLYHHWNFAAQLTRREILVRYRRSLLGVLLALFHTALLLLVYTFVFGYLFRSREGIPHRSIAEFALYVFAGLIVYGMFAECAQRAPNLILANVNYVKRFPFPWEVLGWALVGSVFFHAVISTFVLLVFRLAVYSDLPWTVLLTPLVWLPLVLVTAGATWLLSSLGPLVPDTTAFIKLFLTFLMFLSPIFYPVAALPEWIRPYWLVNPLAFTMEQLRAVALSDKVLDWPAWLGHCGGGALLAWSGLAWFRKMRPALDDVV